MIIEVLMPVLGLTMEEATIVEWTTAVGDRVTAGETLVVVETDKAVSDVPSPTDGILARIVAEVGQTVPVQELIAYLAESEADMEALPQNVANGSSSRSGRSDRSQTAIPGSEVMDTPDSAAVGRATGGGAGTPGPITRSSPLEIAIIGAGPGGYVAALRAAQLGMQVTLVEGRHLGGVCLNRGCIPTKAMLQTAAVSYQLRTAESYGITLGGQAVVNYPAVVARRDAVTARLRNGVRGLLERGKVRLLAGEATLTGPHSLMVRPGQVDIGAGRRAALDEPVDLNADAVLVATGSRPNGIAVTGSDGPRVIDSDGALELGAVPDSIIVVGGGAVGCEWSQIFSRLGAKVTLIEVMPSLLPREDGDLSGILGQALAKHDGVTVHTGTSISAIRDAGSSVEVDTSGVFEGTIEAEYVLVATGRQPFTDGLSLGSVGVDTDSHGWIMVDDYGRTSVPSILAVGDVTGRALLAHAATRQGIVAVEDLAGLHPEPMRIDRVPSVTYTDPEVASVGLTEDQALAAGVPVVVGTFPLAANGRALAQGAGEGLVKIVSEARFNRVLGVHMVGVHVSELLAEAVLALELETTTDELGSVIRAHPTLSEAVGEAALATMGRALHSS